MIYCQNCGKENENGINFCRFCGNRFVLPQSQQVINEEPSQPRPYLWKTDEFQVGNQPPRKTQEIKQAEQYYQPNFNQYNQNLPQPVAHPQPNKVMVSYRCPHCGTHNLPYTKKQISTAGWITFSVLLVTTFIFFWIGLLLQEEVKVCPVCNCRINF